MRSVFRYIRKKYKNREEYAYNDYFDGDLFSWESQNRQNQESPLIKAIINEEMQPLLFVRINDRVRGVTQPFVYCGRLSYMAHAGGNPVEFWFVCVDYEKEPSGSLAAIYQWKPSRLRLSRPVDIAAVSLPTIRRGRGQGRQLDPVRRRKIEEYAMQRAIAHYISLGYTVQDTSASKPYDLVCRLGGNERRVEVKGTIGEGLSVDVTAREVFAARRDGVRTDLFIVYLIDFLAEDSLLSCSGGCIRLIPDWIPSDHDLEPVAYRYEVPEC